MKSHIIAASAALAGNLVCFGASAWDQDPFDQYIQRRDSVLFSSGNAKEVNAVTHVIDPWPRYVGNRQIPADGRRMTIAVERYRNQGIVPPGARPIAPVFSTTLQGITTGGVGAGQ
jgi:hypothetical protein